MCNLAIQLLDCLAFWARSMNIYSLGMRRVIVGCLARNFPTIMNFCVAREILGDHCFADIFDQ